MSLILFGTSRSRAFRALWMLEETGLPYEHRPVAVDACATDAELLSVNPGATIPCLLDDDFALSESLAINLWLACKASALEPLDARGEALAAQWSFWAASLEPAYVRWASHSFWLPEYRRDPVQATAALAELRRSLGRLDAALARQPWLLGSSFCVADLNVAGVFPLLRHAELGEFPHAARWLAACCARDAYARAGALA
ncbi:MAG: glutathione S-transferase family protein [Caulobacter sp.]|nr:glutathione S-transferase family protein [Vitreoscilla sp.]